MWTLLPLWLLVAFVLRAAVALSGDFLLHPDEIMQYLEPAHQLVFGNGVIFWEHYYGARSWIVPGLIAGLVWLCALIGLDSPQYYIAAVKLVFCAVSLAIPLGMYLFCRRHWGEQSARLALVFGVVWYEFVAFAHKPMTEFIATALLCVLLAVLPLHAPSRAWRGWAVAGVLGMLAVAVRFQYAPIIGVILLVGMYRAHTTGRLAMIGGGAAVLCVVGALETWTWGVPLYSYWFNMMCNLLLEKFRVGESTPWLVPWWMLHASCGLFAVAVGSLVWNVRRRGFVLVLLALVMLPHMLSAHREYRYIFAAVPLWLMVFADVVAVAGERRTPSGAWMRRVGVGAVALVSMVGLFNAIPDQNRIYTGFSQESSHFSFLHDRDPSLQLYRRLSEDDAVRGVLDASQVYATSGGYYYLHHTIPFYDRDVWNIVAGDGSDPAPYVSHIIARASAGGGKNVSVENATGQQIHVLETDHGHESYPVFIGDPDSGELVYWRTSTRRFPQPGYAMVEQVGDLTLWHNPTAPPPKPWRDHAIYTFSHPTVVKQLQDLFGERYIPQPPPNFGIDFTDD